MLTRLNLHLGLRKENSGIVPVWEQLPQFARLKRLKRKRPRLIESRDASSNLTSAGLLFREKLLEVLSDGFGHRLLVLAAAFLLVN
jgi:hypothetical protein